MLRNTIEQRQKMSTFEHLKYGSQEPQVKLVNVYFGIDEEGPGKVTTAVNDAPLNAAFHSSDYTLDRAQIHNDSDGGL